MENVHRCIIEDLLEYGFSSRSYEEQLEIVTNGRSCPELPNLLTKHTGTKVEFVRRFSVSQYNSIPWLTGCEKLNKLFCWPCLLFSSDKGAWVKTGFDDLNHLTSGQQRHEKTKTHVQSFFKCKMLEKERIGVSMDSQEEGNINKYSEVVRKNRDVLKRLIDLVCFLAMQDIPLQGNDESTDPLNRGNYIEILELIREYDPILENHLTTATDFKGTSPSVQNDIIHAIRDVLIQEIKKEVASSTFVAIIIHVSYDASESQLSCVLRFEKDGVVYERFVGSVDISLDRTVDGLITHISSFVEKFNISKKLIGQTYDGLIMKQIDLLMLQNKVLEMYPEALSTYSHRHVLNVVLQQSLFNIKECKVFFGAMNEFSIFFCKSSEITVALEQFVHRKLPLDADMRHKFTSRLVNTVKENHTELTAFFESVLENCFEWDAETIVNARGFLCVFCEFNFLFLLEVFSKLFSYTDVLCSVLQRDTEIRYCEQTVNDTIRALENEKQGGFNFVWSAAGAKYNEIRIDLKTKNFDPGNVSYRQLYSDIIDSIVQEIYTRYASVTKLQFCNLLSPEKYKFYKLRFPDEIVESLKSVYSSLFDISRLKSELTVLYSSEEFSNLCTSELVKFMNDYDLTLGFKEVYKLAELILTVPSTVALGCSSTIQRIQNYYRSTQCQETPSSLNVIYIEKELLQKLRTKDTFHDRVIEKLSASREDESGSNKAESESGATSEDREEMSRSDEPMPEVGPGFGSLYDAVDALREISNQNKDSNQFHAFAHHVAVQLEQLPLEDALMLQSEIQNLITSKRVQVLRDGRATMVTEEIDIKPLILPDN